MASLIHGRVCQSIEAGNFLVPQRHFGHDLSPPPSLAPLHECGKRHHMKCKKSDHVRSYWTLFGVLPLTYVRFDSAGEITKFVGLISVRTSRLLAFMQYTLQVPGMHHIIHVRSNTCGSDRQLPWVHLKPSDSVSTKKGLSLQNGSDSA